MKDFVKTEVKIYLDGKEVTNFFANELKIISTSEAQSGEVLKRYDSFSGSITLTHKQARRLIREMVKVERNYLRNYLCSRLFKFVQGIFSAS